MAETSETKPEAQKMNKKAVKVKEYVRRLWIEHPANAVQVGKIVEDKATLHMFSEEIYHAISHFGGFSSLEPIHLFVETLSAKGTRALKHKNEYRKVVPGKEAEQVADLLTKLPGMVSKLSKSINKCVQGRVCVGLRFHVQEDAPRSVQDAINLPPTPPSPELPDSNGT